MVNLLWRIQKVSPAVLGILLAAASTSVAIAAEQQTPADAGANATFEVEDFNLDDAATVSPLAADQVAKADVAAPASDAVVPVVDFEAPATTVSSEPDVAVTEEPLDELVRAAEVTSPQPALELAGTETSPVAQVPAQNNSDVLDQINRYGTEDSNGTLGQGVPGASQFSDVSPSDWAYQALDDLVRRYDCLAGYPDGTYRGRASLSRYEFAAGLNACLQQIERLIAASTADFVTRDDLEALQRLIQEFEAELATLGTRVDSLEGRVAFLEDHQFSTTTKLSGEVIMALTNDFGDGATGDIGDAASDAIGDLGESAFGNRVRLELNTSFTGRDRLVTRLNAGNLDAFRVGQVAGRPNTGAFSATQTFNVGENNNNIDLDWLAYYFPYQNSQAYVAATGGTWSDIAPTLNPYFEDFDGGNGSISTFSQRNPIYRIGGGSGAALSFGFSPIESVLGPSTVTVGYMAGSNAATPGAGRGLFNGDYSLFGQLNFNAFDSIALGLTYVHGYHSTGSPIFGEGESRVGGQNGLVGSYVANNPWAMLTNNVSSPTVTNSYGGEFAFNLSESITASGFITWTDARLLERGDADIWTYGLGLSVPDFGKEGSVLGLFGGIQPTLRGIFASGVDRTRSRTDDVWHVEGFYKYQLTDNITITPGLVWVMSPNQDARDSSNVIGTLRTTFSF